MFKSTFYSILIRACTCVQLLFVLTSQTVFKVIPSAQTITQTVSLTAERNSYVTKHQPRGTCQRQNCFATAVADVIGSLAIPFQEPFQTLIEIKSHDARQKRFSKIATPDTETEFTVAAETINSFMQNAASERFDRSHDSKFETTAYPLHLFASYEQFGGKRYETDISPLKLFTLLYHSDVKEHEILPCPVNSFAFLEDANKKDFAFVFMSRTQMLAYESPLSFQNDIFNRGKSQSTQELSGHNSPTADVYILSTMSLDKGNIAMYVCPHTTLQTVVQTPRSPWPVLRELEPPNESSSQTRSTSEMPPTVSRQMAIWTLKSLPTFSSLVPPESQSAATDSRELSRSVSARATALPAVGDADEFHFSWNTRRSTDELEKFTPVAPVLNALTVSIPSAEEFVQKSVDLSEVSGEHVSGTDPCGDDCSTRRTTSDGKQHIWNSVSGEMPAPRGVVLETSFLLTLDPGFLDSSPTCFWSIQQSATPRLKYFTDPAL